MIEHYEIGSAGVDVTETRRADDGDGPMTSPAGAGPRGARADATVSITTDQAYPPRAVARLPRTTAVRMEPGLAEGYVRVCTCLDGKDQSGADAEHPRPTKVPATGIVLRPSSGGVFDRETRVFGEAFA